MLWARPTWQRWHDESHAHRSDCACLAALQPTCAVAVRFATACSAIWFSTQPLLVTRPTCGQTVGDLAGHSVRFFNCRYLAANLTANGKLSASGIAQYGHLKLRPLSYSCGCGPGGMYHTRLLGQLDQSPLSISSCRSHSGSCRRSRKCQLSPHSPQTTVFPSGSVWPPAVRRNSSLSHKEAMCWQGWQEVPVIFLYKLPALSGCANQVIFKMGRE
jgi:hypothetical protein